MIGNLDPMRYLAIPNDLRDEIACAHRVQALRYAGRGPNRSVNRAARLVANQPIAYGAG